jgi:hypothetical protein
MSALAAIRREAIVPGLLPQATTLGFTSLALDMHTELETTPSSKGGAMSHIVSIQTKVRDPSAIAAACQRLNLPTPTQGTAKLFSGNASGLLVQLPGCGIRGLKWSANGFDGTTPNGLVIAAGISWRMLCVRNDYQTEAEVANAFDRFAGNSGDFAIDLILGHANISLKRTRPLARNAQAAKGGTNPKIIYPINNLTTDRPARFAPLIELPTADGTDQEADH